MTEELLTYGEAYIAYKDSMRLAIGGELIAIPLPPHKKRMTRTEAGKYYTEKIRKEFDRLSKIREPKNEKINYKIYV